MGGKTAYRTKFFKGATEIAGVEGIDGPGFDVESIDITPLSKPNNFMRKLPGDVDPGQTTIDLIFDPEDSGQIDLLLAEINEEDPADRIVAYSVKWSITDVTWGGNGFLKSLRTGAKKGDKLTAQIVIEWDGEPDFL